jgi:CelD/BcsL family acetyltransferase involved in cellulose biosynthesis
LPVAVLRNRFLAPEWVFIFGIEPTIEADSGPDIVKRLVVEAEGTQMSGSPPRLMPELITDPARLGGIEDEWRALAEQRSNGFVTPEWLRAWWNHQGHVSSSLLVVAVRKQDGALAGVMPLALDASSRPRAIRFAGADLGDRFHPVASTEDEAAVAASAISALQANGTAHRMVMLEHVEPGRPWLSELRDASPRRLALSEQSEAELPYVPLEGLDWETYVSQRTAKFRSQIRRRERVLLRDHEMKVHSADEQTLETDLDEFFRLHAMRWQGRGQSALTEPQAQAMLREFAASALGHGWLRLIVIEAEGSAIAAFLGWRVGDSYVSYNTGFDPAWSNKSVGTVLTSVAIRGAIEEGAREFDFLLGTEPYKRSFTSEARPGVNAVLIGALRPMRLLVAGKARARRAIAGRPALGRVISSLARLVPTARRS